MEQPIAREFKIGHRIDKSGDNSVTTLVFELLAIFGIIWVGSFILPLMLSGRSSGARHNEQYVNFLLELYNHPAKYYIVFTIIAATCTALYLLTQLLNKKIMSISIDETQIKFIVSNRICSYFRRKYVNRSDVNTELKKTRLNELKGIVFYNKDKKIGYYEFNSLKRPTDLEMALIDILKSK